MVTKVNDTVFDAATTPISLGIYTTLRVNTAPVGSTDVVNLDYFQNNSITSAGGTVIDATVLFQDASTNPLMELNVGNGNPSVGPDVAFINDGYTNSGNNMYIGFDANAAGGTLQFVRGGATVPASQVVGEFGNGWLRITRPDQPGTPDDSVYLLLDQQPSGTPAPGGAKAPSVIFHNPDQTVQSHAYNYTRLQNEDGSILKVRAGTLLDGTGDVDLMSIMQAVSPYFDFHAHLLKNALDPVDPQDVATKAYTDAVGGASAVVAFVAGDPGYIRYGNGFTIQWGTDTTVSSPEVKVFPWAFTTAFAVVTTPQTSPTDMSAVDLTPTTYQVEQWTPGGVGTSGVPYNFIAIGII